MALWSRELGRFVFEFEAIRQQGAGEVAFQEYTPAPQWQLHPRILSSERREENNWTKLLEWTELRFRPCERAILRIPWGGWLLSGGLGLGTLAAFIGLASRIPAHTESGIPDQPIPVSPDAPRLASQFKIPFPPSPTHSLPFLSTVALLSDGRLLLVGGYLNEDIPVTGIFDPALRTFSKTGPMLDARQDGHTVTPLPNGRVLITGEVYEDSRRAEIYDPKRVRFVATGPMGKGREWHTATLLGNGKVLITGGTRSYDDHTAELYDPKRGRFTPTGPMVGVRDEHSATLLRDGQVLLAGGNDDTAELYDPATGSFTGTGSMVVPRMYHSATLLQDGRVLIAGGKVCGSEDGNGDPRAELYDPATGSFTATGSMDLRRWRHAAVLLPNGKVLITGGKCDAYDDTNTVELYDPQTGTFSRGNDMQQHRSGHVALFLPDGQLVLAGGIADGVEFWTMPPK